MKYREALEYVASRGTSPEHGYRRNKAARLVNLICLVVIAIILPHLLLTIYYRSAFASWVQVGAMLHLGLAIALNARGHFKSARILALVVGNFHVFQMALILGIESGIQHYFAAAIVAPLFFFERREVVQTLLFAALTIFLAVVIHFEHGVGPYVLAPGSMVTAFFFLSIAGSLATVLAFVFHFYNESMKFEASLQEANARLLELSRTDPLTQLANRRSLRESLAIEWGQGARNRQPLAIVLIDIDNFKSYNDSFGHQQGDECLTEVSRAIEDQTRDFVDFPARFGGEEFIVLMSNARLEEANEAAERIRAKLTALAIPHPKNGGRGIVTCSFGIASCTPEADGSPEALISLADDALYVAKANGRDRVEASA